MKQAGDELEATVCQVTWFAMLAQFSGSATARLTFEIHGPEKPKLVQIDSGGVNETTFPIDLDLENQLVDGTFKNDPVTEHPADPGQPQEVLKFKLHGLTLQLSDGRLTPRLGPQAQTSPHLVQIHQSRNVEELLATQPAGDVAVIEVDDVQHHLHGPRVVSRELHDPGSLGRPGLGPAAGQLQRDARVRMIFFLSRMSGIEAEGGLTIFFQTSEARIMARESTWKARSSGPTTRYRSPSLSMAVADAGGSRGALGAGSRLRLSRPAATSAMLGAAWY